MERFLNGVLLLNENTGKFDIPLSPGSFDGTEQNSKSTITVSSPGTPETVFTRKGTLLRAVASNEDSSDHKFYIYDDVTKIATIFVPATTTKVVDLRVPIDTSLKIDSDSSTPFITVVYR